MRKILAISGAGLTSLVLASCGGGGSDSGKSDSVSQLDPKANQSYTGSRDPALLNESNTLLFASLIMGDSVDIETLYRAEDTSASILTNQSKLIDDLLQLTQTASTHSGLHARTVSESESCEYGGTVSANGDVDPETFVGYVVYTFTNCKVDSDSTFNGKASETAHSDNSITLAYDALTVSQGSESYSVTGTVTNDGEETVSNLTSVHTPTGLSTYLQDYTTSYNDYFSGTPKAISGKAFISNEGYITVSTSQNYSSYSSNDGIYIPLDGEIRITGAAQSKARVVGAGGNGDSKYTVGLDANGDGVYELTSIQDQASSETVALEENTAPTSVITASHYNFIDGNTDHNDNTDYVIGTSLQLYSDDSYDNDDSELLTVWTIEERPDSSNAEIIIQDSTDLIYDHIDSDASFTPDVQGSYKISLKVTDHLGSGQSSISFITINIANSIPTISELDDYFYDDKAVGSIHSVGVVVSDRDTFTENPGVAISYEWLERPTGSIAELLIEEEYLFAAEDFGFDSNTWYSFVPDKVGTYKLRFKATDADGAFSEEIIEIYARSTELTSEDFQCHGYLCDWENKKITINELTSLDIIDSGFSSCDWELVSISPEHNFAPDIYQSSNANSLDFTPTQEGEYDLSVVCDSDYSSAQTQFNTTISVN